jgi:transcription initiation factor TFIIE subunit alpha
MEKSLNIDINDMIIKEYLVDMAGEDAPSLVKASTVERTDEEIAKKTGIKINTVRTVLNRLHYLGILEYDREKDEKTNWFTYTWRLRPKRLIDLVKKSWVEKLCELQNRGEVEEGYVYFRCQNKCERFPFEVAIEYDFKCPHCGQEMKNIDNVAFVKQLKETTRQAKKQLSRL